MKIKFNGKKYKVVNHYTCPYYGTTKVQFYVGNILWTIEATPLFNRKK